MHLRKRGRKVKRTRMMMIKERGMTRERMIRKKGRKVKRTRKMTKTMRPKRRRIKREIRR